MENNSLCQRCWFFLRPVVALALTTCIALLIMFALNRFDSKLVQSGAGLLFCMMGLNIALYYYHFPENWTKKFYVRIIIVLLGMATGGAMALLYMNGIFSTDACPFYVFVRLLLPGYDYMLCDGQIQKNLLNSIKSRAGRGYFRVMWFFVHEFLSWAISSIIFTKIWNTVIPDDYINFALFSLVVFVYVAGTAGKSVFGGIKSNSERVSVVFIVGIFIAFCIASFFAGSLRQLFMNAVSDTFIERPSWPIQDRDDWDNTVPLLYVQWVKGFLSFFWAVAPYASMWAINGPAKVLIAILGGPILAWALSMGTFKDRLFHFYWHVSPTLGENSPMIWYSPFNFAGFEFGMLIGNMGWIWNWFCGAYPLVWRKAFKKEVGVEKSMEICYDLDETREFETTI